MKNYYTLILTTLIAFNVGYLSAQEKLDNENSLKEIQENWYVYLNWESVVKLAENQSLGVPMQDVFDIFGNQYCLVKQENNIINLKFNYLYYLGRRNTGKLHTHKSLSKSIYSEANNEIVPRQITFSFKRFKGEWKLYRKSISSNVELFTDNEIVEAKGRIQFNYSFQNKEALKDWLNKSDKDRTQKD